MARIPSLCGTLAEYMTFEEFKQLHSETIMYCQCIEHDLKWIYSYMLNGNQYENFETLEKTTLGVLVFQSFHIDCH